MRVLETRTTPEGFKRRRYRSASGLRFSTIEVPMELWEQVNGQGRNRDRAAAVLRKQTQRSKQLQARHLVRAGRSRRSVAKLLGVAESTVRRWVSTQEGEQHARQQSD